MDFSSGIGRRIVDNLFERSIKEKAGADCRPRLA